MNTDGLSDIAEAGAKHAAREGELPSPVDEP